MFNANSAIFQLRMYIMVRTN